MTIPQEVLIKTLTFRSFPTSPFLIYGVHMKIFTNASVTFLFLQALVNSHAATATINPAVVVPTVVCTISITSVGTLGYNNGLSVVSTEQAGNGGTRGTIVLGVVNANGQNTKPLLSISKPTLTNTSGSVTLSGSETAVIHTTAAGTNKVVGSGEAAVSANAGTYYVAISTPLSSGVLVSDTYTANTTVTCS